MIPCTIRSSLSIANVLKQTLPKQTTHLSKKLYSTTGEDYSNSSGNEPAVAASDTEKKEKLAHFWELPDDPSSTVETNRSVKSRTTRAALENKDFRDLLDTLFDRNPAKPKAATKPSASVKTDSVIEQKLLDLVLKNRQLYKEKAPLPRGMMAPIYGKSNKVKRQQHYDEDNEDDVYHERREEYEERNQSFDFLNPSSTPTNWDLKNIQQNKRIQQKEKELQAIHDIVGTKTSLELLTCIYKEVDQPEYPKYYPKLLTKAIEHASARNDPYLATTIFELAKTKSMESYVLGCTTKVYDAMLLLRWETWRDVYGMLQLVEEMTVNGVKYSNNSRRIIRSVVQEIEAEGGAQDLEEEEVGGNTIYWNADEKRACNVMKELAGKWMIDH